MTRPLSIRAPIRRLRDPFASRRAAAPVRDMKRSGPIRDADPIEPAAGRG